MSTGKYQIKWSIVFVVTLIVAALFCWETNNLKIETDILESMPHKDPVLADARLIIKHLPVQDKVFIDLEQASADRDKLISAAAILSDKLSKSGLFVKVGIGDDAKNFPELIAHVNNNLPSLLSLSELEQKIQPLLSPEKIREAMAQNRNTLEQLEGIGRGEMIARDPLGFSGIILRKMSALLPANKAQFYQGQLISKDGRHALIIARIKGSGTDTAVAVKIQKFIDDCRKELRTLVNSSNKYTLTSVGAYRAALDNESIAKRDMRMAILLTTLGIALLLIFAFPRPLIGLLALLPSSVGAIAALFVCSFFFKSMSIVAIGFGGAIMAFTVDLGITYLLFLDQPRATYGKQVAQELWSAELLAVLTTLGAFLLLLISDFKILVEIGLFSALGVTFALLFVHFIFPKIFPAMPPAAKPSNPLLFNAVKKFAVPANWKIIAAIIFSLIMLFFAKPVFNVDLNAMNSMSEATVNADKKMQDVWGNLSGKCYASLEAPDIARLQKKNEELLNRLSDDVQKENISEVFLPSVLFPSRQKAENNFAAWRSFWNNERIAALKKDLTIAARENGFAPDAFESFWKIINQENSRSFDIPEKYFEMLGITKSIAGYTQLSLIAAGKNYNAEDFFKRISESGFAGIFDVDLFNKRLGEFLKNLFLKIALIISLGLVGVVFLYFLDWQLSLATLAPVAFALIATLGTLKLIGHPLDIPGIMLWIVIMGMGIDYAIYYVCTYQRYPDENSPAMHTIKLAMFLAAFTTLVGFGVLIFASHSLLRSIGIVSFPGIGFSLVGTYCILPVLMKKIFSSVQYPTGGFTVGSKEHLRRTVLRYRHLPAYPRVFARMKMMIDPMFRELDKYVKNPRRIIDIGCGFGVPATWLLEIFPQAQVFGIEPDEERVLIASRAIGSRGSVVAGRAPDLPHVEGEVDYVLMLDMLHLISDNEVKIVFQRIYGTLTADGTLIVRATIPSDKPNPWKRRIEEVRLKITRAPNRFRAQTEIVALMEKAGFVIKVFASDTRGIEEKWFVGKKQ
ncbi:MAG: methyltransferase domain-containing protein [Syntrophaceae bacterium]|nr:methyltransferase domain-containing protein [Syntrophaceae bacterium]